MEEKVVDDGCGCWCYRPSWLRPLRRPCWALICLCFGPLLQGMMINGMLHFFISTIERRFGLDSKQSGTMLCAYDVASLLCMVPVTFLGGGRFGNKPRWIGAGLLVLGFGAFIFILPAFLSSPARQRLVKDFDLCKQLDDEQLPKPGCRANHTTYDFWLLYIGNFLHGVGASPIFTLAVAYIDENVGQRKSSLYLGIYYSMTLVGPAIGYLFGGYLIRVNADFLFENIPDSAENADNPSWIGCWWIGFFVCSICAFILAALTSILPKKMPGTEEKREGSQERVALNNMSLAMSRLPAALLSLLSNVTFLLVCLGACCEGALMSGISAFLPKILENQFGIHPKHIAAFLGSVVLPSALAGTVMGGWIVNFFKLDLAGILKMCVICMTFAMLCVPSLFIVCPGAPLVGVTSPYSENKYRAGEAMVRSLWSDCNKYCRCDESYYSPVCGVDSHLYYSACFAGCTEVSIKDNVKELHDCSCIVGTEATEVSRATGCTSPCPLFPLFIVFLFCYQFFTFCIIVPGTTAVLRSVEEEWRALGMGVQWVMVRSLGTIPGPVLVGWIIDTGCIHWRQNSCPGGKGDCILYDTHAIGRYIALLGISFKALQVIFFSLAKLWHKKRVLKQ